MVKVRSVGFLEVRLCCRPLRGAGRNGTYGTHLSVGIQREVPPGLVRRIGGLTSPASGRNCRRLCIEAYVCNQSTPLRCGFVTTDVDFWQHRLFANIDTNCRFASCRDGYAQESTFRESRHPVCKPVTCHDPFHD